MALFNSKTYWHYVIDPADPVFEKDFQHEHLPTVPDTLRRCRGIAPSVAVPVDWHLSNLHGIYSMIRRL